MVTGRRDRAETCINHPDRPAVARCAACHKPVCGNCVVSTAEGKFCSHQCADRTADFRTRYRKTRTGSAGFGPLAKFVLYLVVLVIILFVVNRFYKLPYISKYLGGG